MSSLLIFSHKCKHSNTVLQFIKSNPQIAPLVKFHDVNVLGIPQQYKGKITSVPTLLTSNGKFLIGSEVIQWFTSLLPSEISNCDLMGTGVQLCSLEDETCEDNMFRLDNYGQSLQPIMTPELEAKIKQNVTDAYSSKQQ